METYLKNDRFSEAELEKAFIQLFEEEGYEYVSAESLDRDNKDILLLDDLYAFIKNKYQDENLTCNELEIIKSQLTLIASSPLYDGNKATFNLISEGFDLNRDDITKLATHIDYLDYENLDNNIFKVVNQFSVQGERLRRPDLLLFVNGIPICIFEFKSAISESTTIHDAWEQINIRYARDISNLLKYCFLSVISDGANTKMGSIFTPYHFYYSWNRVNDEDAISNGISSVFSMVKGAFTKERLLKIIRDYIFYPDNSNKDEAIICRYPQFFAAEKMLDNIKHHLRPVGDGKGGTYFGATGCGKTYTMLFLSRLISLRDTKTFKNPTIIIIVDREDLDTQTTELFVNAKKYLHEEDVRSIKSRQDLEDTLKLKPSGGVYITSIQKFCESTGLLSNRENIICISDEAHRTQSGIGPKLKQTKEGLFTTYGFAKYLRDGFPNATYCGFTGTPIDETIAVFGDIVDSYTMKQSSDDGITVRIAYEPRLARVILSESQAKEIQEYYNKCEEQGANPEQVEESKRAMSKMKSILAHPERLKKLAKDIVSHYEKLCLEKPKVVQKAMIVCSDRNIAFRLLNEILKIKPEWGEKKKTEDNNITKEELDKLLPLPKIAMVATQGANDEKELFDTCGNKEYRKMLDRQFKNNNSNFKIAVVVDMWITGFDVPSLAVMYIDKPLQRHTLIQTISRVNRVFDGKDKGLVVDYIGIKNSMMQAIKKYGSTQESPIDELNVSLSVFRNQLSLIDELFFNFNASKYYFGNPLDRLNCLNEAAEYIQTVKENEKKFMIQSKRMKSAYEICFPSGELSDEECSKAQFYLAIRSIIYKQTKGDTPDAEIMNQTVEKMVKEAITCTGIEDIIDADKQIDLFNDDFLRQLDNVKMPITKFNALLKLLKHAINGYGKTNKVKSIEFDKRLKEVVETYNNRDKLIFTSEVVDDFVNDLSEQLLNIYKDLQKDQSSFEKMGITFEEKAFYDILVKVRDEHEFPYEDSKCVILAKKIKELVDDKSKFVDWSIREDIKSQLNMELTILLYNNGYPPEWDEEVFDKVMEQAENMKKYK